MIRLNKIAVYLLEEVYAMKPEITDLVAGNFKIYALSWGGERGSPLDLSPRGFPLTVCVATPANHPGHDVAPFYQLFQMIGQEWDLGITDKFEGLKALKRLGIRLGPTFERMLEKERQSRDSAGCAT